MKKVPLLVAAVTLAFSASAFATGFNECHGNCTSTQTPTYNNNPDMRNTNNVDNDNRNTNSNINANDNRNTNSNVNGNSNINGNDNRNTNSNDNRNNNNNLLNNTQGQMQGQAQGQMQGQAQGQSQGQSQNTSSNSSSTANNALSNVGNAQSSAAVSGAVSNNIQYVSEAQKRNPVSTAWAPALTSSNGTCMGSTSAGGQGVTVGLSFGTTWTDEACNSRYDAISLNALGLREAAIERLCQRDDMRKAIEASGGKCKAEGEASNKSSAIADQVSTPYYN